MISVGYMAKRINTTAGWTKASQIVDVYSVSDCISDSFADYVTFWRHNGYFFFDSPEVIEAIARENSINLSGTTLFFYEVYELQFDSIARNWLPFSPEPSFPTNVVAPNDKKLEGYDVVTFTHCPTPEHSPLSCNDLAAEISTNPHCLIESLEEAKQALEAGKFTHCEPGPYRIFAVYTV